MGIRSTGDFEDRGSNTASHGVDRTVEGPVHPRAEVHPSLVVPTVSTERKMEEGR